MIGYDASVYCCHGDINIWNLTVSSCIKSKQQQYRGDRCVTEFKSV